MNRTRVLLCLFAFFSACVIAVAQGTAADGGSTKVGGPDTALAEPNSAAADAAAPAPTADAQASASTPEAPKVAGVWEAFFPEGILDASGKPEKVDGLNGKIVGLYFSAHWCPPCRTFSPKLVEFRDAHSKDFEVVFISSDKDEAAQFGYMKQLQMKWFTVKHRSMVANAIAEKYGVQSIPTLIILSPNGDLISATGRADVSNSPGSCLADWKSFSGGTGN